MEKVWLKSYPPGIPAEIDPNEFASIRDILVKSCERFASLPAFTCMDSTLTFTEQHLVTNGASELFVEVFGERGKHARSAFGVAQIPLGACVEIELIAEVG